jgi:hypothetical protein
MSVEFQDTGLNRAKPERVRRPAAGNQPSPSSSSVPKGELIMPSLSPLCSEDKSPDFLSQCARYGLLEYLNVPLDRSVATRGLFLALEFSCLIRCMDLPPSSHLQLILYDKFIVCDNLSDLDQTVGNSG